MTQLLDIKSDFIFKQVFGQEDNKDILISLLNAILQDNPKITEIVELYNTDIPKIFKDNRGVRLDVLAMIEDRTYINIEIQCQKDTIIPDRAIQYLSKTLVENPKATDPVPNPRLSGFGFLRKTYILNAWLRLIMATCALNRTILTVSIYVYPKSCDLFL